MSRLSPASNFNTSLVQSEESSNWPFLFLAAGGFNSAYGNGAAPLGQILTKQGKKDLKILKTECLVGVALSLYGQGYNKIFVSPAGTALPPAWETLASENDPVNFTAATPVPLLIVSGDQDTTVYPNNTEALATALCALSPAQDLERWLYAGLDHDGIVYSGATINDLVQWTVDRFANDASPDFYTPTGGLGHTVTVTDSCG